MYLLLATLRLLLFSHSKLEWTASWKWSTLIHLLEHHPDEHVRWFVVRHRSPCSDLLRLGWPFSVSPLSLNSPSRNKTPTDRTSRTARNSGLSSRIPFGKRQCSSRISDLIYAKAVPSSGVSCDRLFLDDDFKKRTRFISGLPLAKSKAIEPLLQLTRTATIEKSLREIALSISLNWPTLISSPISNGKTLLVEYMAEQLGKRLIKIQCSDHMDSKVRHSLERGIFSPETNGDLLLRSFSAPINALTNQENSFGRRGYWWK